MQKNDINKGKYLDKATERPTTDFLMEMFEAECIAPLSNYLQNLKYLMRQPNKIYVFTGILDKKNQIDKFDLIAAKDSII